MLSPQRKKYDSFIIQLYNQNKENLLPKNIKSQIPHSTASGWRNLDYQTYFGHEAKQIQNEALEYYELFQNYTNLKRTFQIVAKFWVSISKIVMPMLNKAKEHQEIIVCEIQRLFTVFPKKLVFKLVHMSSSAFNERLSRVKLKCGLSPLQLCFKRHPLQLATNEVEKIKSLYEQTELKCWPAISLYYYGIRNNQFHLSKSTFYKYVNLLGLKRKWAIKSNQKKGLNAKVPNEYLHVDTTFWELENRYKAAIVFVSDNFSKKILGWSVALTKDAENVKNALVQTISTIHQYYPKHLTSTLIADGGGENNNLTIDKLLQEITRPEITKVIALKDISFSNSPVEAINKIMKRYLRYFMPNTFEKLVDCLKLIVKDYNEVRPHGSLDGLTPMEAYTNATVKINFSIEKIYAKALRILENKKLNCTICQ
tara:strand:- start:1114 stop:2388 length:1275 start_codon:yes stop_codon:yes gene_type:complete